MTIEELEAMENRAAPTELDGEVFDEDDESGEELLVYKDMNEALALLRKSMHLLDYLADYDLCKSIKKAERESMARLSEIIDGFLDETEGNYAESEEEDE